MTRGNPTTPKIGRLQRAVLWHIEAEPGGLVSWQDLVKVVRAASVATSVPTHGLGFARRTIDGMLKQGMIDFSGERAGESTTFYTMAARGWDAIAQLESKCCYNPLITETNND